MTFAGLDPRFVLTGVTVTDRQLVCGTYVTILEVEHSGQKYAGKKIHANLLAEPDEHARPNRINIVDRFMEESRLLSQLHHPNIVQFVGVYFHQGERLPILVMELLHTNLHACIKQHGHRLPKDIAYSILHDVALGLHYLHSQSPPIMHRDINARNILLTSKMSAKIDFGVARCFEITTGSLSRVSGTLAYMPPEAFPRYDTSIDVFSYGIIMIFMFSGEFPGDVKPPRYSQEGLVYPGPEAERREKYLQAIGNDHPAMTLILQCIADNPKQRPTATEISQQIKRICQYDVPSNEERLDLCKKALEKKETVDQVIMQGVFVGFPRSGKTSTKKRLMGKRPNRQQASTGVAEKASRVEIEKTIVQSLSSMNWHEINDLDEETAVITDDVYNFESQKEKARMDFIKHNSFTVHVRTSESDVQTQKSGHTASYSEFNPATISGYLKDVEIAIRKFERKFHNRQKPWTIYLKDTGGQPEFQELLPALVSGPSLYFLFFRLDQDLNKKYLVQYQHPTSGRLIEPFEASFTMKEALLQFLASIASTRSYTKIEDKAPVTPKVLFIGTHKDNLQSDQQLKDIDKDLQQAVRETDAFKEGMIEFATKDNLILAIENFPESEEDVQEDVQSIRDVVERIGMRSEVYSVRTPYSWLLLSIILRKQRKRILSLDTCMEIAKKCRIDTMEELQNALWFLHHNTGVVRYFQEVLALKDVIIVEPQYIFDKLTELIVKTLTFEGMDCHQYDEFIKKGIFSCDMIQKLTTESDGLDEEKLKALLEYLHIVAPIEEGGKTIKYFAPCTLAHAKPAPPISLSTCKIPSILLTFGCGYCPKGIFGSLVVKLLDKDKYSEFEWSLEEDHIYRDQLLLSVGPFDSFRFQISATFIQIDLVDSLSAPSRLVPLKAICNDVRHCIERSIEFVSKKLHYTHKAAHSLAFLCSSPHNDIDTADAHPAVINTHKGQICSMTCTHTNKKLPLPDGHNVWFNEPSISLSEDESNKPPAHGEALRILMRTSRNWHNIGVMLGLDNGLLGNIDDKYRGNPDDCLREMLSLWLKQVNPPPTRKALAEAVEVYDPTIAKQILN